MLIVSSLKRVYFRFLGRNSGPPLLEKPLLEAVRPQFRANLWFNGSFFAVVVLALAHSLLTILALDQGINFGWNLVEFLFYLFQAITNVVILVLLIHEKKYGAVSHRFPLRMYWVLSFVLVCLSSASALTRLVSINDQILRVDDVFSLMSLPLYLFLFIVSIRGSTGIITSIDELHSRQETSNLSGYTTASLFSKAVYNWMNPIMKKGYEAPLQMDDVPWLPPDHQAEAMGRRFEQHWSETSKNPVRTMLLRGFWKDLAITGFLAVVRLAVMYVGPVLIKSFVSYTAQESNNLYEGFLLIFILFFSKVVEVLSSHQFNFLSNKLGMLIRSSLITALYKKGLRLSSSSKQTHGLGQIVNYMAVDCQQLADLVYQLHTLWMMPFEVGIALLLLYTYLKVSVLVSLVAVIAVMILTRVITQKTNYFQFNLMMGRDVRMRNTTELLNNMRVIKFQAWEQHFHDKIQSARDKEYGWLSKFLYTLAGNIILLWSMPLGIAAITFGAAMLLGIPLDAGTVFTATSIFKILQEPIQSFPQTLISVSQAIVSLERLDAYLTSHELEEENVERECDGDDVIAIEVRDGTFAWDEQGEERVLEDLNFEVKRGEVAAIVGMVGSGKSSLLAAVLGELRKVSGKV